MSLTKVTPSMIVGAPVFVGDYGAVGDGTTNDTAAFEAAIAAATGEVLLDPTKTYAVNLVIAKDGIVLNGQSGVDVSYAGITQFNLIPYDAASPVVQIGDDSGITSGAGLRNITIWSQTPGNVRGSTGLRLAGGAASGIYDNISIGNKFTDYAIHLQSETNPVVFNKFSNIQLHTLTGYSPIATLGAYYGASYTVANTFTGFNIGGPVSTGYAILLDSVELYMAQGWVQASDGCGIKFQNNFSKNPILYGVNFAVDSDSSSDVLLTSDIAANTSIFPLDFVNGSFTVDGKYQNAALTETALTGFVSFWRYQSLSNFPVAVGSYKFYNTDSGNADVTMAYAFGAADNVGLGHSNGTAYTSVYSGTGGVYLASGGSTIAQAYSGGFRPQPDGTLNLGSSGQRWATVYATTGTINTSDVNEKQDIADLSTVEKATAAAIKSKIKKFRFKDAVKLKGDDARVHVGVIAQDVEAAFKANGLDPERYGIFCKDILDDGSVRYGVRYEELLAFIIGAL